MSLLLSIYILLLEVRYKYIFGTFLWVIVLVEDGLGMFVSTK